MQLDFHKKYFIARGTPEELKTVKRNEFRIDPKTKTPYTESYRVASRYREICTEKALKEINRVLLSHTPFTGKLVYPKELELLHFQPEAIKFALERNRSYLAMDPGLGKTICAAVIRNTLRALTFYICPPFLVPNVKAEMEKWAIPNNTYLAEPLLVADSVLIRQTMVDSIADQTRYWNKCLPTFPTLLIVDEAHRFKNMSAQRTKILFKKIVPLFDRVVFLSGTPMPNRPIELFPVLSHCAPETIDFMDKFHYGMKYCSAERTHFGWDFSGASNIKDLAKRISGTFLLRQKKALLNLPPVIEEMVVLDATMPPELATLEQKILKEYSPKDLMKGQIGEDHISSYRRELGNVKVEPSVRYIKSILEDTDEAILVFAYHKEAIANLALGLKKWKPEIISGDVPTKKRFELVQAFQEDKKSRLLILQINAGGIGFNLTKAERAIFVEFSWVPSDNTQAIARAHRHGQTKTVTVQYLVYRNSLDRTILDTVFQKNRSIKHI